MLNLHEAEKYFPQAPQLSLDKSKTRAFDELWEFTLNKGQCSRIEYQCEYPKHEFLTYLVERKGYLLHGSNFPDITTLIPVRVTQDTTSYGNHEAVYASTDGIWPIFFAVVNRNLEKTSWVSTCRRALGEDGTTKKFYFFSVHERVPKAQRFTDGMVYVLPREPFMQLLDDEGTPIEEWMSTEPVTGLAKLPVSADDFPFHENVQSHDDEWLSLERKSAEVDAKVYSSYVGRYSLSPGFVIEVFRGGNSIFLKVPGYPPGVMWPISETLFALPPFNIRVAFDQNATQLTLKLDGQQLVAPRIE